MNTAMRRFTVHKKRGKNSEISPAHEAVKERRTRYPAMVTDPSVMPRLLKRGQNSVKIGDRVTKGKWRGMHIFTLTLEERKTCPPCLHETDCYGNKMHWPSRIIHGKRMEDKLEKEIHDLALAHQSGFVIRLHVLGDFYSIDYVEFWQKMLMRVPQLRVFGYTAHDPASEIGQYLRELAEDHWDRFAVRFSNPTPLLEWGAASTVYKETREARVPEGIVCPAQTDRTDCCATCALCWQTRDNIVFIAH